MEDIFVLSQLCTDMCLGAACSFSFHASLVRQYCISKEQIFCVCRISNEWLSLFLLVIVIETTLVSEKHRMFLRQTFSLVLTMRNATALSLISVRMLVCLSHIVYIVLNLLYNIFMHSDGMTF